MARIVGYIASSLDGFIADPQESLTWLTQRTDMQLGEFDYNLFIKRIRTVVMGRGTYDWLVRENIPWPYGEQRVIVVTSRPLPSPIGALDEIEIYVISQLLGGGFPLFPATGFEKRLKLLSSNMLGTGCVRLHYSFE